MISGRAKASHYPAAATSIKVLTSPGHIVTNDRQGLEDPGSCKMRWSYRFVWQQGRSFSWNGLFETPRENFPLYSIFPDISTLEPVHILPLES